jgi:cobalt-zinc-cadmium efflux system protein
LKTIVAMNGNAFPILLDARVYLMEINDFDHPSNKNRFTLAILITLVILSAEAIGGWWTGSLALLSDAGHVLADVFALGLSYLAVRLASLPADDRHTYGYHRLEVLAALVNGVTLVAISAGILYEAYRRWSNPPAIKTWDMLVIAAVGLVANLIVAYILRSPSHREHAGEIHLEWKRDLNLRSAFLHVTGDAASSLGVILAALIITISGATWIDPLASALIGGVILIGAGRVLRSSIHILIEGTPEGLSLAQIRGGMLSTAGVAGVHDLHVWNICSGQVALSAHVLLADGEDADRDRLMAQLKERLKGDFNIEHTTIQFECEACSQGLVQPSTQGAHTD